MNHFLLFTEVVEIIICNLPSDSNYLQSETVVPNKRVGGNFFLKINKTGDLL